MPQLDEATIGSLKILARQVDPTCSLHEVRPGVVRKVMDWGTEQWCRVIIASRAAGMNYSQFIRIVVQEHLNTHTTMPEFLPPAKIGVSKRAIDIGSRPQAGNDVLLSDPFGGVPPISPQRLRP